MSVLCQWQSVCDQLCSRCTWTAGRCVSGVLGTIFCAGEDLSSELGVLVGAECEWADNAARSLSEEVEQEMKHSAQSLSAELFYYCWH